MLTASERRVLRTFREYLMTPGKMLCFDGPAMKVHRTALHQLTTRGFLVKERVEGAYSLTPAGFAAMRRKP